MRGIFDFLTKKNKKIFRYIVSGGSATVVNLVTFFIFLEIVGLWYIYSAILSFLTAFFVSFYMQKYWTFEDKRQNVKNKQMIMHFLLSGSNLLLNALGLYILVDFFDVYPLVAQVLVVGVLSLGSFLVYNIFIFQKNLKEVVTNEDNNQ